MMEYGVIEVKYQQLKASALERGKWLASYTKLPLSWWKNL